MYSDTSFFSKKNIFNLLLLGIMALGIPLATNALKEAQILRSRAANAEVKFVGDNIKLVGTTKYATSTRVDIEVTAQHPAAGTTADASVDAKKLAMGGWIDKAEAGHCGSGNPETVYCANDSELWSDLSCADYEGNEDSAHTLHTNCSTIGQICRDGGCVDPKPECAGNPGRGCHTERQQYCDYTWNNCSNTPDWNLGSCTDAPAGECGRPAASPPAPPASGAGTNPPATGGGSQTCTITNTNTTSNGVTGTISGLAGRNRVHWELKSYSSGALIASKDESDVNIGFTGINPGQYTLSATVYTDPATLGSLPCGSQSVSVAGGGQPGGGTECVICDNKSYRATSASNCSSSTAACDPKKPDQGACKGTAKNPCDGADSSSNTPPNTTPNTPPATPKTVSFKWAMTESGLVAAPTIPYTSAPTRLAIDLDANPNFRGSKTVFVEFTYSSGPPEKKSATIEVVGPDPTISGGNVSCSLDLAGTNVTVRINGANFGPQSNQSKVTIGNDNNKKIDITSWSNTAIVGVIKNPQFSTQPSGALATPIYPLTLTRGADSATLSMPTECGLNVSQISVGGSLICRAKNAAQLDNVELTIVENRVGGTKLKETVSISKDGIVKGSSKAKLQKDVDYIVCLKAPGSVRRCFPTKGNDGTVVIKDSALPVGDVFPAGGDCAINSLDASEVKRQWSITQGKGKSADFNQDGAVNSIDWTCMNKDFGQSCSTEPNVPLGIGTTAP